MKDHARSKTLLRILQIKTLLFLGTGLALFETLSQSFGRLCLWVLFFTALWLFQIPTSLGSLIEILVLLFFIIGVFYCLWKDARLLRWPNARTILNRIEAASALEHRPLSTQNDQAVNSQTPEIHSLWIREKNRKRFSIHTLVLFKTKSFFAARDPYALRTLIFLAAFCGFMVAGSDAGHRVQRGLMPFDIQSDQTPRPSRISLTLSPPEYTGKERIILTPENKQALEIPEGSTLKLLVQRPLPWPFSKPVLHSGAQRIPLSSADNAVFSIEHEIEPGDALSLYEGFLNTASWRYTLITDKPPEITDIKPPESLQRGEFKIPLSVRDDYSVQTLKLQIERTDKISEPDFVRALYDERSVMSPPGTVFKLSPVYDFTDHPWAGQRVNLVLSAFDHKGQSVTASPIEMVLPERVFTVPLAKALIKLRKELIQLPLKSHTDTALTLESFMSQAHDRITFMALRSASSRLYHSDPSIPVVDSVIDLLWDTALHIEDGRLSLTQRDLKTAQAALEQALKNPDTTAQEIAALMQNLREALGQYLSEIGKEWQKRMQDGDMPKPLPPEVLSQLMNTDDLARMLDKMEADMMDGNRESAQQMLSQLQRLMEMTTPGLEQELPEDIQKMMAGIDALKDLIKAQELLLEDTGKQAALLLRLRDMGMNTQRQPPPFIKGKEFADRQDALHDQLLKIPPPPPPPSPESEDTPSPHALAAEAMEQSSEMLNAYKPDLSLPHQKAALEYLRQLQQSLSQQIAERMKQMTGLSLGAGPMQYDPLGRPLQEGGQNPSDLNSQVKIPSEQEKKRIQEIVNEIRRRAGQRERPQEELEYYRRLLKPF
jgi:uncharacterized protein (TIGR02302 family)